MPFRFLVAALFVASLASQIGSAQQITSDMVISGASLNDGYGGVLCGNEGQIYRFSGYGRPAPVMRVSRDGSTTMFYLPDEGAPEVIAPAGTGLNILASRLVSHKEGRMFEMDHFDNQANLLMQHRLSIDFVPTKMAITSSGKTVVLGFHPGNSSLEDHKYGGAVLDAGDQVIKRFELPLPPGGGGWTFGSGMSAGDDAAYVMLYSNEGPKTAIATISAEGHLDVKLVRLLPDTEDRHHNEWLFGSGVAVEEYRYFGYVGGTKRAFLGFDEYDLRTGEKVATKSTVPVGFVRGCYLGNEFSMLAHSAHVDPVRGLSPETLRVVTTKLMDGQTTR